MPGSIAGFTVVTSDIEAAAHLYKRYLGYGHDQFTRLEVSKATLWGLPGLAGARQALLRPSSRNQRFIRFIEEAEAPEYRPLASCGWNAIELVVQNLDRIAADLAGSPFRILGHPETVDLGFTDRIRAMQVAGPAGEVLYLTEISGTVPGFDLPAAQAPVDCAFVAVLGASSLDVSTRFYSDLFRTDANGPFQARIGCLSAAHGLVPETRHALSTIGLSDRSLIEIDAYPANAGPCVVTPCGLPAGIAFASFRATDVGVFAGIVRGPDDEWTEIVPALS